MIIQCQCLYTPSLHICSLLKNREYGAHVESIAVVHPSCSQDLDLNTRLVDSGRKMISPNLGLHAVGFCISGQVNDLVIEESKQLAGILEFVQSLQGFARRLQKFRTLDEAIGCLPLLSLKHRAICCLPLLCFPGNFCAGEPGFSNFAFQRVFAEI